jgi:four helix bundle protein
MKNHKDLDAWKESIQLAIYVYQMVATFPPSEIYGLNSQIKRSVVSVASNIAEGAARNSRKEFIRFLNMAQSSLSELETQLIIAKELNFLSDDKIFEKLLTSQKLVGGLIRYLKKE